MRKQEIPVFVHGKIPVHRENTCVCARGKYLCLCTENTCVCARKNTCVCARKIPVFVHGKIPVFVCTAYRSVSFPRGVRFSPLPHEAMGRQNSSAHNQPLKTPPPPPPWDECCLPAYVSISLCLETYQS